MRTGNWGHGIQIWFMAQVASAQLGECTWPMAPCPAPCVQWKIFYLPCLGIFLKWLGGG